MVRAWLKPTHHAWLAHASLTWSTSTSPDQKRVFPNFQFGYYRIIKLGPTFSNSHNFWPSMAHEISLRKSNGLGALFESYGQQFF
jgi:hypothetical protein